MKQMKRMVSVALGAMLALLCLSAMPAAAADHLMQPLAVTAPQAEKAVAINTPSTVAVKAASTDATASASGSRTSHPNTDGASAPSHACSVSVVALEVDHSPGIALTSVAGDPDDDEDAGDGKLAA